MSDEILKSEFDYISQTAFQANEDRGKITNFYLVSVGSLIASAVSMEYNNANTPLIFSALFFVLSISGLLTILQLIRLREAWFDSAFAMNRIKAYYVSKRPDIEAAFQWKTNSLPKVFKRSSVAYWQVLQIAFLGAATFAAGIIFLGWYLNSPRLWEGLIAGGAFLIAQMIYYRYAMQKADARMLKLIEGLIKEFDFTEEIAAS